MPNSVSRIPLLTLSLLPGPSCLTPLSAAEVKLGKPTHLTADGELLDIRPDKKDHVTGTAPAEGPAGRAYSALALDWDNDGDLDLLVGDCHLNYKDGKWDNHGYVWIYRRVGG